MNRLEQLKRHLRPGRVYRRADLAQWSKSVDRHARELVDQGVLQKLRNGLYYYPKASAFGRVPPDEKELVRTFLKEDDFLLTSPNAYNALGVGTTQLYNSRVVYNHKRHGRFTLGGKPFEFRTEAPFPQATDGRVPPRGAAEQPVRTGGGSGRGFAERDAGQGEGN